MYVEKIGINRLLVYGQLCYRNNPTSLILVCAYWFYILDMNCTRS